MNGSISKPDYLSGQTMDSTTVRGPWLKLRGFSLIGATAKWAASAARVIAHDATDAVVASTGTWHFANGNFTAADKGGVFTVAGASNSGNNGAKTILTVVDATHVTTATTSLVNETFGGGVTVSLQQANPKGTFGFEVSDDGELRNSPAAPQPTLNTGNPALTVTFTGPNTDASSSKCEITAFPHHWGRFTYTPDGTNPGGGVLNMAVTAKGY